MYLKLLESENILNLAEQKTKRKKKKRTFKHDPVDVKSMATSLAHGEPETH